MAQEAMKPVQQTFQSIQKIRAAKKLQYTPDKLYLGVVDGEVKNAKEGYRYIQGGRHIGIKTDQHAITIAGSRAGKGRSAIIPNMLKYTGSIICIDPKGENAIETARTRAKKLKQRICVLDPFQITKDQIPKEFFSGFNPFSTMNKDNAVEQAALMTDALVITPPDTKDPHWDESARTLIEGVILYVFFSARFSNTEKNLVTVRNLLSTGIKPSEEDLAEDPEMTGLNVLEDEMLQSEEPVIQRAATDFFEKPEKERDTVLSTARRHLKALSLPELEQSLSSSSFDLGDLKREAMTVYLCLPARHLGTCGRWLRLFINIALQSMETARVRGKEDEIGATATGCPVLFILDEFASLGHMKQIEDAAGQIAGYGVKLWPILQDLGQLKALYKDRWETFLGNAGILQFFGNNDLTTLEWISKRLGKTTIIQKSGSEATPHAAAGGSTGESFSPHTTPIMEPTEIALRFGRTDEYCRQVIIRAGMAPLILHRVFFDKHDDFKRLRR